MCGIMKRRVNAHLAKLPMLCISHVSYNSTIFSIQACSKCPFNSSKHFMSSYFMHGSTICHFFLAAPSLIPSFSSCLSCCPFCKRFARERRHQHTNLLSLQSYLQVLTGHSCSPLYAFLVLRIRRASLTAVCQISTMRSSLLQSVLSSPSSPPVSQQSQRMMCSICTIVQFACDNEKYIFRLNV